jgi:hypothetical protein
MEVGKDLEGAVGNGDGNGEWQLSRSRTSYCRLSRLGRATNATFSWPGPLSQFLIALDLYHPILSRTASYIRRLSLV